MNKITTIGRLGKDAGIFGQGATKVFSFSVGSNTGYGDKQKTVWYKVTAFVSEKQLARAEKLKAMLVKGTEVCVHGDFSEEEYQDKKSPAITTTLSDITVTKYKNAKPSADAGETSTEQGDDGIPF